MCYPNSHPKASLSDNTPLGNERCMTTFICSIDFGLYMLGIEVFTPNIIVRRALLLVPESSRPALVSKHH